MSDVTELERRLAAVEARLHEALEVPRLRVAGPGRSGVEIGVTPDGEPEIVLVDRLGRDRALLRLVDDEAALEMMSSEGRLQLRAASGAGTTRVVLWAGDSGRRCELRTTPDGASVLLVVEGGEAVRTVAGVTAAGESVLRVEPAPAGEGA